MVRNAAAFTFLLTVMMSSGSLSASDFEGVWKVKDTAGKEFEITLFSNRTASSNLRPDMIGTWKEEGASAVIKWETGWTTKIVKSASGYLHLAYRPRDPLNGRPAGSSDAEKIR